MILAMTPELSGASVVGVGAFNPAIVHPSWLAEKQLLPKNLADYVLKQGSDGKQVIVSSQVTSFVADWLTVQVTQQQLVLATVDRGRDVDLRDLSKGLFELLPETPVDALGLNVHAHFRSEDEITWHAFGDKFMPKDHWESLFEGKGWVSHPDGKRVGMRAMTAEVTRSDPKVPGYVRVELAPSIKITPHGIYVSVNSHFQLTTPDRRANASDAARVLITHWAPTLALASNILSRIAEEI